ncbi:MAG: SDR family NAD(P)-dependent oxidoreductase [Calditrichaeota bacterium]|nr:MAG: SDR family NAD(P)-dependent oxidoreductase [Calditrichota bacterium]
MNLENKVFLITGATSGIGREAAVMAAQKGAFVGLIGRNQQELDKLSDEISLDRTAALPLLCDVTNKSHLQNAFDKTVATFGKLDVLVNSAGIIYMNPIEKTSLEEWQELLDVNLTSVFIAMQMAIPHLEKTQGNIINVSSVVGTRSFPGVLGYAVSKSAVDQLTRCAALDLAPKKIRVNAVNPGVVMTNLHRRSGMDEQKYADFLERSKTTHPIGRYGKPHDIASAILYLADDDAGWVTGVTLNIDGGRHLTCAR